MVHDEQGEFKKVREMFVTEETQFCVIGGLHTDLNQCKQESYANPLYVVQEGPDTMTNISIEIYRIYVKKSSHWPKEHI